MFDPKNPPTSFELEVTTRCNAACPQCSRNYYGAFTWPSLPMVDLELSWIKEKFTQEFLSSLNMIRLVGTYGDPCVHPDLIDIVRWIQQCTSAQIVISTNGSLRTRSWWKELGSVLRPQDRVLFCIDGLEDTNHIYRKGTNFKKIIGNLREFNIAGGHSVWSFIAFEHNQHQIETARILSQELGCHGFAVKPTGRFVDKQHRIIDQSPVMDLNSKVVFWLRPPNDQRYVNAGMVSHQENIKQHGNFENYLATTEVCCDSQVKSKFYVSAEGLVFPCGWLADRMYGFEAETHPDRQKMFDMIESCGGFDSISLNHQSLDQIIYGKFFQTVSSSWQHSHRLQRCAVICGSNSRTLSSYKEIDQVLQS